MKFTCSFRVSGPLLSLGFSASPIRGKCRRQRRENTAPSSIVHAVTIMSEARNLAKALNLSHRDGLDLMGGADAQAIEELIIEFMAPGSEDPSSDCKYLIILPLDYNFNLFITILFFR